MVQSRRTVTIAWILLVVVTLASLYTAESSDVAGVVVTLIVVLAAAVKAVVILVRFMGAKTYGRPWQGFFLLWLGVNALVIFGYRLAS